MINKVLALVLVFSLAFNVAFVGIYVHNRVQRAKPQAEAKRPPGPGPSEAMAWDRFGLAPEQRKRIMDDWRQTGRKIAAVDSEMRDLRAQLINLLQADTLDEKAVRSIRDKIEVDQRQVREIVFNRMMRLRQELMPEQRRLWVQMMLRTAEGQGGVRGPMPRPARSSEPPPPARGPAARGPAAGTATEPAPAP
jgi:Spy/CpxP family protein refolding chaperone